MITYPIRPLCDIVNSIPQTIPFLMFPWFCHQSPILVGQKPQRIQPLIPFCWPILLFPWPKRRWALGAMAFQPRSRWRPGVSGFYWKFSWAKGPGDFAKSAKDIFWYLKISYTSEDFWVQNGLLRSNLLGSWELNVSNFHQLVDWGIPKNQTLYESNVVELWMDNDG